MAETQAPGGINLVPMHSEEPEIGGQPRSRNAPQSMQNSLVGGVASS